MFQPKRKSRPVKIYLDSCTLPYVAVSPICCTTSLSDTTWPTHWLPAAARPQGLSQHARVQVHCYWRQVAVRYTGRVPLTLHMMVMFYCLEIRKAPNMLSCHGVARSSVWVCPLQNVYASLHFPFVSRWRKHLGGN
jgi:hypothetical protein